jgi:hypothetical protein
MNRNIKKECGVLTTNTDLQTLVHTASSFTTDTNNYTSQGFGNMDENNCVAYVIPRLNPTIKNFHHVTFLKELDSLFIKSKEQHTQRITKLRPTGHHPNCLIWGYVIVK